MSNKNKEINNQAFYRLLEAGLWENEVSLKNYDKVDFMEVYRLSEEQTVTGLIAAGLEHVQDVRIPQDITLTFVGAALQLEQNNTAMNLFVEDLISDLRKKDIYALLVKGQGIAQCYERPLWRTSGDIDLFLSTDNYEKAKRYLLPISTSINCDEERKHIALKIDSWVVELHGSLCGKWFPKRVNILIDSVYGDIFYMGEVRSWENNGTIVYLPSANNDAILIFTHILEHLFVGGIGLRQICDWCRLLWKYKDSINKPLLENRLKDARIMSEWKTFAAFAVDYLGMPVEAMPLYSSKRRWSRKAKRILFIIMKVGNMGHNIDVSYAKRNPYIIRKIISLGRHLNECFRILPVFPIDSVRVLLRVLRGRLIVAAKKQ